MPAQQSSERMLATSLSRTSMTDEERKELADRMVRASLDRKAATSKPPILLRVAPSERSRTTRSSASSSRTALPPYEQAIKGSPTPALPADHEQLKRDLRLEMARVDAQTPDRNTQGLFKEACSTDLLFLIDTTYSMRPYIDSVKSQVKSIIDDVTKAFLGEAQIRIAVVSYTDHNQNPGLQLLDFTTEVDRVRAFVQGLKTEHGGDLPENVLGGVNQAMNASWRQQNRCMIHIADAPPHGPECHDLPPAWDHYYKKGSEPHGLDHATLLRNLVRLHVNYTFLRINPATDKMALVFSKFYRPGNAALHESNKYYKIQSSPHPADSQSLTKASFQELPLGTDHANLRKLVVRSVTSSFSRTASRLSKEVARHGPGRAARNPIASPLPDIVEGEDSPAAGEDPSIGLATGRSSSGASSINRKSEINWDSPESFGRNIDVEGHCPAVQGYNQTTLNEMMAADEHIPLAVVELTIRICSTAFSEGAMRKAYYARTAASDDRFVAKKFKKDHYGSAEAVEDMKIQALCKAFALQFNELLDDVQPPLDFVVTSLLLPKGRRSASQGCMSLEPYLPGAYIKYNNNAGYKLENADPDSFSEIAQAFSHFTFERSYGHLLVNDLQGVGHLLTDPAIQTKDKKRFRLNATNCGEEGMKMFFATHACNSYCAKLELQSCLEMFGTGEFTFRQRWPLPDPKVCCSNRLCRRIVKLASAHQSDKFEHYRWCDSCWAQLEMSTMRVLCMEKGCNDDFEISPFFFESQGELPPQKCPSHRETKKVDTASVGKSLWNKIKGPARGNSVSGKSW